MDRAARKVHRHNEIRVGVSGMECEGGGDGGRCCCR